MERVVKPAQCPAAALELAVKLGRDEQLGTRRGRGVDPSADRSLVPVSEGGIEQPVAEVSSGDNCVGAPVAVQPVGAEPELRHLPAVVEAQCR